MACIIIKNRQKIFHRRLAAEREEILAYEKNAIDISDANKAMVVNFLSTIVLC
jgi:hypothetical protein